MSFQLLLTRLDKMVQAIRAPRLFRALLYDRVLAGAEHRQILSPNIATVVDIGANRGQFSLAARRWAPRARVIAFEPLSGPAARFGKVFQGDYSVILHQAAIGPETGEATIHVSAADDSSSLLPISGLQERLFPGTEEVRTETVKVGRLADFVSPKEIAGPALLKLDVQGFELEVLRGCEDLLDRFANVYAECSFVELYKGQALAHEIIAWLQERGFHLSGVYNLSYDRRRLAVQGDFLFVNASHMSQKITGFAPRSLFEKIFEFAVIPNFDLILDFEGLGVIMLRRKIAPYSGQWALPGLRMMKGENISDTLNRIAENEVGIVIDPDEAKFVGQYVGKFRSEFNRQDISTCYAFTGLTESVKMNQAHFSGSRYIQDILSIPKNTGAMYRYYLQRYFETP